VVISHYHKASLVSEDESVSVTAENTDGGNPSNVPHSLWGERSDIKSEEDMLKEFEEVHATRDRSEWPITLKSAGNAEVFTSKVRSTIALIRYIRSAYPNEKMIIFSVFLTFLGLVEEALERGGACFVVYRIDGTRGKSQVDATLEDFARGLSLATCFVTAGAGALGVNMEMASKVIQADPWWNLNAEEQAYYRCCGKQGKKKNVEVYILRGSNSVIDFRTSLGSLTDQTMRSNETKYVHKAY
jgi:SNF2 family DNA or RNA helicase